MRIDFMGVGFGRTGSNWLCNCLIEHPEISIPKFNLHTEINYFPEEYRGSEEGIYDVFRCDGVHGWNLHRSMISGERNDRNHLNNKEGILYLSLYDFFDDLQDAFNNYLNQLVKDKELINNLLNRYKEIRVVVDKIMDNHYTG